MRSLRTLVKWPDLKVMQDQLTGGVVVSYEPKGVTVGFIHSRILCSSCEFEFYGSYPIMLDPTTLFCPSCSQFAGEGFDASSEVRVQ